ncbi:MAG: N-formylglutamate amidohydrolase [Alphaproteobacteria bacterium]
MLKDGKNYKYKNLEYTNKTNFVFFVDHASNKLPRGVDLGVDKENMKRHVAYDIGIEKVSEFVADELKAPLIKSKYSRLFVDCNRFEDEDGIIPHLSDDVYVKANEELTDDERQKRIADYHESYHKGGDDLIEESNKDAWIINMHSFTPKLNSLPDDERPWEIALIWRHNEKLVKKFIEILEKNTKYTIGNNQPYDEIESTTYSMERRMVDNPERNSLIIEIRQDLIADDKGAKKIAGVIAKNLKQLFKECN